jgi:hypothetical protein
MQAKIIPTHPQDNALRLTYLPIRPTHIDEKSNTIEVVYKVPSSPLLTSKRV